MDLVHRPTTLKKGEWGKLLILAGSSQFSGAAVLASAGALRTGLDIVVFAGPERTSNAVLYALPDVVSLGFHGKQLDPKHLKYVAHFRKYPVVIGSGILATKGVGKFLKGLLKRFDGPFVLDADALRIVAKEKNPAKLWAGKHVILTPNRTEYALLTGDKSDHPLQSIEAAAKRLRATILCKGATDVISDGTKTVEVAGGSPYLAKAGTGDVLAGSAGALLARGLDPFLAAETASRLLKATSERVASHRGPALLAGDVADALDLRLLKRDDPNAG